MWRSLLCLLTVGGAAATTGCADHGSYQVGWQFAGGESADIGCGAHGVDSIRVIGSNTAGDSENFAVLCSAEGATHNVVVGTWTLGLHQVDVRGVAITPFMLDANGQVVLDPSNNYQPIPAPDPTTTIEVLKDRVTPQPPDPPVVLPLTPRPECSDGIDNDGDGRVDLDDPECMGNPYGTIE